MPNGEFALRSSLVPDQLRRVLHSRQTQRASMLLSNGGRGKFTPLPSEDIYVIDDGSTDGTGAIAASVA